MSPSRIVVLVTTALVWLVFAGGFWLTNASATDLSISGVVWEDLNADGVRQTSESGLPAQMILFAADGSSRTARATADGSYSFGGLNPGSYVLRVSVEPSVMTFPARKISPPFEIGYTLQQTSVDNANFGLLAVRTFPEFVGLAFKNGERVRAPNVRAMIRGADCTGPPGLQPPDRDPAAYDITVLPDEVTSGCLKSGDSVRFTINGEPANESNLWLLPPPGLNPLPAATATAVSASQSAVGRVVRLDLTIGPPFAYFVPEVFLTSGQRMGPPFPTVEAFIGSNSCGRADFVGNPNVILVVPSDQLRQGCGVQGAVIHFAVDGVRTSETVTWTADKGQPLRLTKIEPPVGISPPSAAVSVSPPTVGDAGLK